MLTFISLFGIALLLSGIFINGFYNITRGEWVKQPNSKEVYEGMIFKFWSRFLQEHKVVVEYYKGAEFHRQFVQIQHLIPTQLLLRIEDNKIVTIRLSDVHLEILMANISGGDNRLASIERRKEECYIFLYKRVKKYTLPELIRMPLGGCVTCMASVYGTICWLFWYKMAVYTGLDVLTGLPPVAKVGLWVYFCISLAWVNEIIFNINHKLKNEQR
jgi:hypothetical protein